MNKKGQALVIFVIFLPVILIIGTYVIDLGLAKLNENKVNQLTKEVTEYGLRNIEDNPRDKMIKLIYQNDENIDTYKINIDEENKVVIVNVEKSSKGVFGSIAGRDFYKINVTYKGSIINDKMVIERGDNKWKRQKLR